MQFSQLRQSMANVKFSKYFTHIFAQTLTVCEKLICYTFDLQNVGQGHGEDKRYVRRSIENVLVCIAEFFNNFSIRQHTKTNEFHTF